MLPSLFVKTIRVAAIDVSHWHVPVAELIDQAYALARQA